MDNGLEIICGDALEQLRRLPDETVQCCVTSPPYFGLRDYKIAGQIGLELEPLIFLAKITRVFSEIRRVLRADGTCWLNFGDGYASDDKWGGSTGGKHVRQLHGEPIGRAKRKTGLKAKDLIGMPWRVALALQADGWFLRSDIIWHKPNVMPSSVRDRPTTSHEYIFLLSKSRRYYYDFEAIKEPVAGTAHARGNGVNPKARWKTPDGWDTSKGNGSHGSFHREGREQGASGYKPHGRNSRMNMDRDPAHARPKSPRHNASFSAAVSGLVETRNKRSVWSIATAPYRGAHFATFPPKLIEPCILAGSRVGDVVLDPFAGSGTTGQVALQYGRRAILIELNPAYVELIEQRLAPFRNP